MAGYVTHRSQLLKKKAQNYLFRHKKQGQNSMKKFPIGIQTFAKIRQDNFYYIDQTFQAMFLRWEKNLISNSRISTIKRTLKN